MLHVASVLTLQFIHFASNWLLKIGIEMCLRNFILHKNIKRFIVPLLETRKQICTTYIFPFKTPLPQHHVSTQCHDNMPVRPSSRR